MQVNVDYTQFGRMVKTMQRYNPGQDVRSVLREQTALIFSSAAAKTRKASLPKIRSAASREAAKPLRKFGDRATGIELRRDPSKPALRGTVKLPNRSGRVWKRRRNGMSSLQWRLPEATWAVVQRLQAEQLAKYNAAARLLTTQKTKARGLAAKVFYEIGQQLLMPVSVPAYVRAAISIGGDFAGLVRAKADLGKSPKYHVQVGGHPALNDGGLIGRAFVQAANGRVRGFFTAIEKSAGQDIRSVITRFEGFRHA